MKAHLFYATSITFPSQLANRKQVVNQMRGFAQLTSRFRSTLGIALGKDELTDEPFECVEGGTRYLPLLSWRHMRNMRKEGATHVYCREPRMLSIMVAARWFGIVSPGVRIAFEVHSLSGDAYLIRFLLKHVDFVIAVNPILAQEIEKHVRGKAVLVAHDAADPAVFRIDTDQKTAREKLGTVSEGILAMYTGRYRTAGMDKGLLNIIRVLPRIAQSGRAIRVYAVGGSEEEIEAYAAYAAANGADAYITFVPYQAQDTVALYHAAADMLLMPFPWTEHFAKAMSPLKLFEYLMAGRPIIATRLPSIEDVLSTAVALVIEPDSDSALQDAMELLRDSEDMRKQLGLAARDASPRYTWEARAEAIASLLNLH